MKKVVVLAMVCACISLVGCTSKDEFDALKTEVSTINEHLASVEEENKALKDELKTLKLETSSKFNLLEASVKDSMTKERAFVSMDEEGYDVAETSIGPLLICVDDVTEEGDGCKVKLVIGNPNYASINGVKLNIIYNKRPFDLGKEVELSIDKTIQSGSWNTVYVTVPNTEKENLTYMSIGVETDVISLHQ